MVETVFTNTLAHTVDGFWGARSFSPCQQSVNSLSIWFVPEGSKRKMSNSALPKKWVKCIIWQPISPSCSLGSLFLEWASVSNKTCRGEVSFIDITSIHSQGKKTYPAVYMDSCWFLIWNSKATFGSKTYMMAQDTILSNAHKHTYQQRFDCTFDLYTSSAVCRGLGWGCKSPIGSLCWRFWIFWLHWPLEINMT